MKKILLAVCLVVMGATSMFGISAASPKPTIVKPSDLKWSPLPGLAGAQQAVLYGNPNGAGTYSRKERPVI